ncbi:MAG TPA: PAS domain S-box protein, partial [Spirochaetia bacterium]|nr:PAS domain S-box protein [Spirochaetia bacterium]
MRSSDRHNGRFSTPRHMPTLAAIFLLVIGTIVSVGVSYLQFRANGARARETVAIALNRLRGSLNVELQSSIYLTQGLVSLIKSRHEINSTEFDAFAGDIVSHRGTIRDVAVAPGNVVAYVFPRSGNEGIIGVNFHDVPAQWRTVARAIEERRIVVAGPLALVQGGIGIIARVPVFLDKNDGSDSAYWGIISTVIDFSALTAAAGLDSADKTMQVALRGTDGLGPDGAVFWGNPRVFEENPVNLDIALPSGSWQIAAVPLDGWIKFNALRSTYFYAGIALSLILSLLVFQLLSANRALRAEVAERQNAEAEARERERYSRNLIEASVDPFMVIGPTGEVQDVNGAMELVAGRPRSEIVGSNFRSLFTESERAQNGLDRVWAESFLRDYELSIRRPDGVEVHVHCNASLYRDGEAVRGVFVVARDETEREKSDAALQSERQ